MTRRIDNPEAIALSAFVDAYGYWAKRWCVVASVRVEFSDGRDPIVLTPQEFKALPKEVQDIIFQAPSSPQSEYAPMPPLRFGNA